MKLWTHTYKGHAFDLMDYVNTLVIDPHDFAHQLANINRYNGATKFPYSVAQHSCLMSDVMSVHHPTLKGHALFHDGHEIYCQDMQSPIKKLFPEYARWEEGVASHVRRHFGLPVMMPPEIKEADLRMLATEKEQLLLPSTRLWTTEINDIVPYPDLKIACWSWRRARREFYRRMVQWGYV